MFFNLVSNIDVDCCVILLLCCNVAVWHKMTLRNVAAAYQFLVNFVLFTCWLLFCVVAILPCCRWIQDEISYLHCTMMCHFGIRWVILFFACVFEVTVVGAVVAVVCCPCCIQPNAMISTVQALVSNGLTISYSPLITDAYQGWNGSLNTILQVNPLVAATANFCFFDNTVDCCLLSCCRLT